MFSIREGMTRVLASKRASAISPSASLAANAGSGKIVGRDRTRPRVLVNSRLVTGVGDTALIAPLMDSRSIAKRNRETQVVEGDPAHVLIARSDDAAQSQFEGQEHFAECPTCGG